MVSHNAIATSTAADAVRKDTSIDYAEVTW